MLTVLSKKEFLQNLETQPYDVRVKNSIDLGRHAKTNLQAKSLIEQLSQGDFYERLMAVHSCGGSQNGLLLLQFLEDPSRMIRARSIRMLACFATEEQLHIAFEKLGEKQRRVLARFLMKRHHHGAIDQKIIQLAANQQYGELQNLLPYASVAIVKKYLEVAQKEASLHFYERMARFHSALLGDLLQGKIEEQNQKKEQNPRLLWQCNDALPVLTKMAPDRALSLVDSLRKQEPFNKISFSALLFHRPQEIADRIVASEEQVQVSFDQVAHRIKLKTLEQLLNKGYMFANVQKVFKKRPLPQRAVLYPLCVIQIKNKSGVVPIEILQLLPKELRQQEAYFYLNHPDLKTRPEQRIPYAGLLPWEEMQKEVSLYLNYPEPPLRAVALATLVQSVRFSQDRTGEMLTLLRQRKNEQDPVRLAFLTALATLPLTTFQEEHLSIIGPILQAAFDAADLSGSTAAQIEKWVIRFLPMFPQFSSQWLATIVKERGTLHAFSLEHQITDQHIALIEPWLFPVLQAWTSREQSHSLFRVASCLGRRTTAFSSLWELLEKICQNSKKSWEVSEALSFFRRYQRQKWNSLVLQLLKDDASFITVNSIAAYLHRYRQDLLTPFLGQKAYKGRFSTGKTRFVPSFYNGFFRWLPSQQEVYASVLEELINKKSDLRDTPTILWAIKTLAQLPAIQPAILINLIEEKRLPARDTALRALGRLDENQGISVLISVLDDDRGRIAIYALRKAILEMPADKASEILAKAPITKVTVAKEVLRLFGELPSKVALPVLQNFAEQSLHADVRIALLRALWSHLETEEAWRLLEQAADTKDIGMSSVLIRIPAERLSDFSQKRLVQLFVKLLAHSEAKIRFDLLSRCISLPVPDLERVLFEQILTRLDAESTDERRVASQAVVSLLIQKDIPILTKKVTYLLPNRRSLLQFLQAFKDQFLADKRRLSEGLLGLLAVLEQDPVTLSQQMELIMLGLPLTQVVSFVEKHLSVLHSHAFEVAIATLVRSGNWRGVTELADFELALSHHADEKMRRLGLAALIALAETRGWDVEKRNRLEGYKKDQALLVAEAAQFTVLPEENRKSGHL